MKDLILEEDKRIEAALLAASNNLTKSTDQNFRAKITLKKAVSFLKFLNSNYGI